MTSDAIKLVVRMTAAGLEICCFLLGHFSRPKRLDDVAHRTFLGHALESVAVFAWKFGCLY